MEPIEATALRLCGAFQRCSNYPRDPIGVKGLVDGLVRAAEKTGVSMQAIVDECLVTSGYCPTDFDLMNVARGMKEAPKEDPPWKYDEKERQADANAYYSFYEKQVPTLPDGKPDMLQWTANCIKVAVKSFDFPPNQDRNSLQFWAHTVEKYERTHPLSVASVRAGGDSDLEEVKRGLAQVEARMSRKRRTA